MRSKFLLATTVDAKDIQDRRNLKKIIIINSHGIVVSIGGSTLPVVTHTRDLGIIVSSDLLYMSQILFLKPTCVLV